MALAQSLEVLIDILEDRGHSIRSRLQPGLPRVDIQAALSPLGLKPPEELIELYEWHNGVDDEITVAIQLFGEHQFISLDYAIEEYREMIKHYSSKSIAVTQCFPFSRFQGDVCAIYCDDAVVEGLLHPVINIYHGIYIQYENIEGMAQTAIEWFASGIYDVEPVDDVRHAAIRQTMNPRIPYRSTSL
jgi:hypothetical protein